VKSRSSRTASRSFERTSTSTGRLRTPFWRRSSPRSHSFAAGSARSDSHSGEKVTRPTVRSDVRVVTRNPRPPKKVLDPDPARTILTSSLRLSPLPAGTSIRKAVPARQGPAPDPDQRRAMGTHLSPSD
jgi:hypothetical protein